MGMAERMVVKILWRKAARCRHGWAARQQARGEDVVLGVARGAMVVRCRAYLRGNKARTPTMGGQVVARARVGVGDVGSSPEASNASGMVAM